MTGKTIYEVVGDAYGHYQHRVIVTLSKLIDEFISESYVENYDVRVDSRPELGIVNIYFETGLVEEYVHVKIADTGYGLVVVFKFRTPSEFDSDVSVYFVDRSGKVFYFGDLH